MSEANEIEKLIESEDSIPSSKVLAWMKSEDLDVLGAVYDLTDKAWSRILPGLSMEQQCSFMRQYLLTCLEQDPRSSDFTHSGYEAAWELAAWMKYLRTINGTEHILREIALELESLYKRSNDTTRNRIETGTLEHVFEDKKLVKYFEKWESDPVLGKAYKLCLEWGIAHRDDEEKP